MLTFGGRPLDAPAILRDGTHRSATLEATWARFAPAMRVAGITRLADITGLDTLGIPVFAAIRPLGRSLSTQQGKGLTPLAAKVSALMESLETWTAEHVAVPIVRGSYRALESRAVDVTSLPLSRATEPSTNHDANREASRASRARSDARASKVARTSRSADSRVSSSEPGKESRTPNTANATPASAYDELDLDAQWAWVEGRDLEDDSTILVPLDCVTLDTVFSAPPVFDVSSNGLASGNVLVEAILHGLCEVLERDAEAAWRRTGGDRRLVLDTISDPICRGLIDRIVATGSRVFVWDLGATELPVIGCAIVEDPREPSWRDLGCYQGFGAHLLPEIAIARALTEAAQTRLTYIAGARDDFFPADYAQATDRDVLLDLWERLAAPCDEPTVFDDLPRIDASSLGDGLGELVDRVGQVIAVDLTHPKLQVPVVKVIVPGRATDVEAMG